MPFIPVQYRWNFDHIATRLLGLDLGSGQIRNALPQWCFNGAQLSHGKAYFTEGALVQPIDKLTRSDFFPDIIGMTLV